MEGSTATTGTTTTQAAPTAGEGTAQSSNESGAILKGVQDDGGAVKDDGILKRVQDDGKEEGILKQVQDDGEETPRDETQEMKQRLDRMTEANKRLIAIFDSNPEIPKLLSLLDKGATLAQALPHVIDMSDMTPAEGDPDFDSWTEAQKEREKKKTEREKYLGELDNNLQMSQQEIDAFTKENNLSEEESKTLLTTLDDMMEQVYNGKISKQLLSMLRKASTFDSEVETAKKQGEIKARNEKIEAIKSKDNKGDGLPNIGVPGAETPKPAPEQIEDTFSSSIDTYNKKQIF